MGKVICDLCGTVYQDTAESCPICGYTQVLDENDLEPSLLEDTGRVKGGRFVQSGKYREEDDYDEDDYDDYDDYDDEEDDDDDEEDGGEYAPAPRSNAAIVVILVIVVMLLLTAIGYVFFRYFLPNRQPDDSGKPGISLLETDPPATQITTEPTVPCDSIALTGGMAELTREGQYWLLHVKVTPEDTTDDLMFLSGDESIATVTEDGRITAVGEGETTIYITCGQQRINCPVIVSYAEETEPQETGTENELIQDPTASTAETGAGEYLDVQLALKKYDISLTVGYGITLQLDCSLAATDVEWTVEHPHIATVDENGFVKAVGYGTTAVIVKYGDQEVTCIVRCK